MKAATQTETKTPIKRSFTPVPAGRLQRKHSGAESDRMKAPGQQQQMVTRGSSNNRSPMGIGHDFSQVRVHAVAHDDQSNCDLRAAAFACAPDVSLLERRHDVSQAIVEGYGENEKQEQHVEADMESPASVIALSTEGASAASEPGKFARVSPGSQSSSLADLQSRPKDGWPRISGPPVTKDLSAIAAAQRPGVAGYTDWPTGYKAPDFEFNTTATGADFFSRPTLKTAATEGTSGSFYPAAGKQKTGSQDGGKDVYWNISAAASALVQKGEQEHCDDFAEAYKISLKEADDIVNTNLVGKAFGPKPSKPEAEQLVLTEITGKLTHAGLGNDKSKWAGIYNTLFTKTLTRDTSGWHTVSLINKSTDAAGNVVYDVDKGTSQIGTKASNTVIKY